MIRLKVKVELLEDGWYLVQCPAIEGLLAEGQTVGEALDNLRGNAQALYEMCQDEGLTFVTDQPQVRPEDIVWQIEIPQQMAA